MNAPRCNMVVIGCSAGGIKALQKLLPALRADLAAPVIVVCHTGSGNIGLLCELLARNVALPVCEARERMPPAPGGVYLAPADYHLLLEPDRRFSYRSMRGSRIRVPRSTCCSSRQPMPADAAWSASC